MLFEHPTGKIPPHVIMLLLGETKRQYANLLAVSHNPTVPANAEVWTCNAGFRIWQHDLVFVMDDMALEAHKWPGYGEHLADHPLPIMTSTAYPEYSDVHVYPFREVCETLALSGLDRYFFNSVPYMIAYALAIGVEKITLFGADYSHPNSLGREADQANAEWWLGFARGRGCAIELASDTTLMGARERGRPLYGYRFDPRITMDREIAKEIKEKEISGNPEALNKDEGNAELPPEPKTGSPTGRVLRDRTGRVPTHDGTLDQCST